MALCDSRVRLSWEFNVLYTNHTTATFVELDASCTKCMYLYSTSCSTGLDSQKTS